jgi:predicted TIM-barrel fold metal-dependent hydrolase
MFATDYPHWDFDAPDRAFPVRIPDDLRTRIYETHARELYLRRAQAPETPR